MIAVIDSGLANLKSVIAALWRLNADVEVTTDPVKIRSASHVIFPGVGAAAPAMEKLKILGLIPVLRSLGQPVLGICLGMQLLFTSSEEAQNVQCLDIIKGSVRRLQATPEHPVPHMGWNQLKITKPASLLKDVPNDSFVYFVHSFAAPVGEYTVATTDYAQPFSSVIQQKNFFGCQFHPERSSKIGSKVLQNFIGA